MYICLCNALTDQEIRQAVLAGAGRPSEVYRACGRHPQCGSCAKAVRCIINEICRCHGRANASLPE
jgi:bacterioferritin-associated ferredoxin